MKTLLSALAVLMLVFTAGSVDAHDTGSLHFHGEALSHDTGSLHFHGESLSQNSKHTCFHSCIEQNGTDAKKSCAMQCGVTEEAMQRTAAYISEREQFGVPLGSFQALAMRMADSFIDVEAIRSTYWLAMWRLSENLDARAEVRAAKWFACDAATRVVQTAQHLHGGIGADLEYPIHRFFLNAKLISYSLGNASTQLDKLGVLLASDDSLGMRPLEV